MAVYVCAHNVLVGYAMHAYCPKVTLHAEVEHARCAAAGLSTEHTRLEVGAISKNYI